MEASKPCWLQASIKGMQAMLKQKVPLTKRSKKESMYVLSCKQAACKSIPFLVSLNPTRIFYLHYSRGAEMRLLNRLWEEKERKTCDHHF